MFPGEPEIRFDVNGKSDIYDPRTSTTGFTTNWALLVADRLCDPVFGLGMSYDSDINIPQLIAAANVCDELIPLAAGGSEVNWACNWHGDTSTGPADVIVQMMTAAAGRMSRVGGQWYIWPAYWQGPSFTFDQDILLGDSFQWKPYRKLSDRFNVVSGTYTAASYPYNATGNLYDSNGWYDGTIQNNFGLAFQPTNFPRYAMDSAHGYPSNQWLAADGGHVLPKEIAMPCTLSVTQAQRAAKVYLLRNRFEGTGAFSCALPAYQMQPTDVMQMSFQHLGWSNKLLEVSGTTFHIEERVSDDSSRGVAVWVDLAVNATDPTVYEWSTTEEQTIYAVPSGLTQTPYVVTAPTGLTLASTSSTGTVSGIGGNASNWAIRVGFIEPLDALVTLIQIQAKLHTDSIWFEAGTVSVSSSMAYVYGVNQGSSYDVRICSLRASGAASAWLEQDGYTV